MPKNDAGTYFDRYLTFRINTTKDLINAIGGVDVPVTETLNYDDTWGHLHIHFKPGLTHMDGDQAVSYMRFRHDACSDPCRIKRQQQVERLTIEKLKNDKFNDLTHIAQLIDVLRHDVDTNFTHGRDEEHRLGLPRPERRRRAPDANPVHLRQGAQLLRRRSRSPDDTGKAKIVADFIGPYFAATPPPSADALAAVKPAELRDRRAQRQRRAGSGREAGRGPAARRLRDQQRRQRRLVRLRHDADSRDAKTPLAGERVRSDIHLDAATVTPIPDPTGAATAASAATPGKATALADVTIVVGRDYVNVPTAAASPK